MTGAETVDLVVVMVVVLAAAGYATWHLFLRHAKPKKPTVVVGATLAKGLKKR